MNMKFNFRLFQDNGKIYTCGTLTYTRLGLIHLFAWLLWGDFCMSLMQSVNPVLTPLLLKMHNASNLTIGLLMGSIPALLNFILNPIISTSSDRLRTRWGRRIPFLLFTPPFSALFLILLGWSDQIGKFFYHLLNGPNGNPAMFIIGLIAVFVIGFQIFDLFVQCVYYYIFSDVVPVEWLGRFMSLFRIFGTLAGVSFNLLVMPHVKTHISLIYTVIAVIYALGFCGMALHVKEGEYPPPAPQPPGFVSKVQVYFKECFSKPFYLIMFFGMAFNSVSVVCRSMFNVLFTLNDLHLTTAQLGKVGAITGIIAFVLAFPVGWLVDRFHPLRVYLAGALLVIIANPIGFFFVHDFYSYMFFAWFLAIDYIIQNSATLPLVIRLQPKEKFGQFSSAKQMLQSILLIIANAAGGWFIDLMGYRYLFVWDFVFTIVCFSIMFILYLKWKKLGGDQGFKPPV